MISSLCLFPQGSPYRGEKNGKTRIILSVMPRMCKGGNHTLSSFVLRLMALLCMFVDHAGLALFPSVGIFRCIGRLAFPLNCFGRAGFSPYARHQGIRAAAAASGSHFGGSLRPAHLRQNFQCHGAECRVLAAAGAARAVCRPHAEGKSAAQRDGCLFADAGCHGCQGQFRLAGRRALSGV